MYNTRFVDTNILVYAYSNDEPDKKEKAINLLCNKNLFLSTQVINEYIWVMLKKYKIQVPIITEIITNLFKIYKVMPVGKEVINSALHIYQKYHYSYWDSLMIATALKYECDIIYSEDMQSGQIIEDKLKIINPFND